MIIPVLLCVAVVIFTIMYFAPGDPVPMVLGENYTPAQYAAKKAELGLDKPFLMQLFIFLENIFIKFDFGKSWAHGMDIQTELLSRLPRTAVIAVICCLLQIVIAIPLGITAATHQNGIVDRLCTVLAIVLISVPGFWIGMMLIYVVALNYKLLPSSGVAHWYSYIMPCVANACIGIGGMMRLTRSQMLEVIRLDYVVTARAKGIPENRIFYSHALPNALIPILTSVGTYFGTALGGTVVIETVFSLPGIGFYMFQAVGNRDYVVVRGGVTFLALLFCLVVLLIDILYAFIDPRIKAQYENTNKKRIKKATKEVTLNA
jgi:peptide/nickel transport system permease protein